MCKTTYGKVAYWLTIIGGLNWWLVGLGSFLGTDLNVVNMLVGSWPTVESVVYLLVGISAISMLFGCKRENC